MILVDFSSILHRMIHTSVKEINPSEVNGSYQTKEFINFTKFKIIDELMSIQIEHKSKFGDLVLCMDYFSKNYWRKDFFGSYKSKRKKDRDESKINYKEVFEEINELITQLKENTPWKVIEVPKAEADDIMLVLAREFNLYEKVLIHSPDKDMIQAQRRTDNVFQYSALTKKWLVPENKHDSMEQWILEHVCLGDESDGVPKIVEGTEFSESFIKHLTEHNITDTTPYGFKNTTQCSCNEKVQIMSKFDKWKTNRKGERTVLDVFKDMKFGPATLHKEIKKHGSLDKWLDSHPMYRPNYERNFTLVMEEGIPNDIWNEIVLQYKNASTEYKDKEFEDYLSKNELNSITLELPNVFKLQRELTAEDFNW